jgi:putative DNA primase/helicase
MLHTAGLRDKLAENAHADDAAAHLTEDALALRFSAMHRDELRYIHTKGQWQAWDGARWYGEQTLLAFDLVRDSCREVARIYGNGKPLSSVLNAKTVAAVERMARADRCHATSIDQWDANDWLWNMAGETIDLHSGVGHVPDPDDYITKLAACAAAPPGTPHPLWTGFLERIMPDPELRSFSQRFAGYSLTGDTSEHKFCFGYGTGANGKSTYINTIAGIMNDYATVSGVGTFIASNTERHPTDVAKLHGYRLVVAQETEKGRRWDETKIKSMTGGDPMTARFMRCDFFDFVPRFKLFIVGNHKPRLDNVDEAMRRRLLLVPFLVQIPVEERDQELPAKLRAEWPAILRWMLDGCAEWQRNGLAPPPIVTTATDEYFDDQDMFKQWLEDCTKEGTQFAFTATGQLFASWKQWCDKRSLQAGSAQTLSDALSDRGFTRKKTNGVRGFKALELKVTPSNSLDGVGC